MCEFLPYFLSHSPLIEHVSQTQSRHVLFQGNPSNKKRNKRHNKNDLNAWYTSNLDYCLFYSYQETKKWLSFFKTKMFKPEFACCRIALGCRIKITSYVNSGHDQTHHAGIPVKIRIDIEQPSVAVRPQ